MIFFITVLYKKTVVTATRQRLMARGGRPKTGQRGRGGFNNVLLSAEEDRGQHNLSTEDRAAVKAAVQSCCTVSPSQS